MNGDLPTRWSGRSWLSNPLAHLTMTDRFSWAAEVMKIEPAHQILEIGCGTGRAVHKIAALLGNGKITAADRSASAIAKAKKANTAAVKEGKAVFIEGDFPAIELKQKFDRILFFNVNLFWTTKSIITEAALLKKLLKKNGLIFILYGPLLSGASAKIFPLLSRRLEEQGFAIVQDIYNQQINCRGLHIGLPGINPNK